MYNSFANVMLILANTYLLTHCVTARKHQQVDHEPTTVIEKEGQKTKHGTVDQNVAASETENITALAAPTNEELLGFFNKHKDLQVQFNDEDQMLLDRVVTSPEVGSIAEAALVVGLVKSPLTIPQSSNSFEEHDLSGPQNTANENAVTPPQTIGKSLEKLCTDKSLDLAQALEKNSLLQSIQIYKMVADALEKTQNSQEFHDRVKATIDRHIAMWTNFNNMNSQSSELNTNQQPNVQTPPPAVLSAADLRSGDSLLIEAQNLADNKKYKEAITKATLITKDSPLFSAAQEKIRLFSNSAVQDLRKKAAEAFQSSIPVADLKARAAWLQKAKALLEQALAEYPLADQLNIVRENLAVITKDLDSLDQDSEDGTESLPLEE